jgi:glucose-induced degradation protein 8
VDNGSFSFSFSTCTLSTLNSICYSRLVSLTLFLCLVSVACLRHADVFSSPVFTIQSLPASPQLPMSLGPSSTGGTVAAGGLGGAISSAPRGTPPKQMFTLEEWNKRLAETPVARSQMDELVMDYLIIEGYKEAAENFSEESGIVPNVDLKTIEGRVSMRAALQCGDVQSAIGIANSLDPSILDENQSLYFHLQQQKLIELIRNGRIEDALEFAQQELAPRGEENRDFLKELERTMTLLAFEDPSKSPMADLLSPEQRQRTASEMNAAILSSQCQEKEPKLPALLKSLLWTQEQLKEQASFPILDIRTGQLHDPAEDDQPPS